MYMGSLENCEWKMELGNPDVFRIFGINENGRSISPSSPQSFEIQGESCFDRNSFWKSLSSS